MIRSDALLRGGSFRPSSPHQSRAHASLVNKALPSPAGLRPANRLNQNLADSGIPLRFDPSAGRSSGSTLAPFPHPSHRTELADRPHSALGQDLTPSSTTRRAQAGSDVRARSARRGARVDRSRPFVA